jgi:hypothetical protein
MTLSLLGMSVTTVARLPFDVYEMLSVMGDPEVLMAPTTRLPDSPPLSDSRIMLLRSRSPRLTPTPSLASYCLVVACGWMRLHPAVPVVTARARARARMARIFTVKTLSQACPPPRGGPPDER